MQEFINLYNEHQDDINDFLYDMVGNVGDMKFLVFDNFKDQFKTFSPLELIYVCDSNSLEQLSKNIFRKRDDYEAKGVNRKNILDKLKPKDSQISISKPYTSSATGKTCITVSKLEGDRIFFLDFTLVQLLEKLGFIELHKEFNFINKSFYLVSSSIMMILAIFTLGYAVFEFINYIFIKNIISIESIFKPVIALTLGIAIFDLSKTVLEQEVLFKSYSKTDQSEYKVLTKFSVTIIIALLIESLMVVFKIAMNDYAGMIHAVYLISGIAILMLALGAFIRLSHKKKSKKIKD